jgi:hypothetical protein
MVVTGKRSAARWTYASVAGTVAAPSSQPTCARRMLSSASRSSRAVAASAFVASASEPAPAASNHSATADPSASSSSAACGELMNPTSRSELRRSAPARAGPNVTFTPPLKALAERA